MPELEGVSVEAFKGDYDELERMAHASWRDEYGQASFPNFYRPAFLHYLFDRIPKDKRDLLLGAYKEGEIVAFLANLPQTFHFRGDRYKAVYSCLLVVRKEYLRRGLAIDIIRDAVALNKTYGFDFSLLTLEKGHRSTLMMRKLGTEGHRLESVRRSGVVARVLDLGRVASSEGLKGYERAAIRLIGAHRAPKASPEFVVREYRGSDLEACYTLLGRYKDTAGLALVWDREDLARELACPDVARTLVWEKDGRIHAMINIVRHDHIGKTVERWAWINHLVDLLRQRALLEQEAGLAEVAVQHAVADEAVAHAGDHADLLDGLRTSFIAVASTSFEVLAARTTSSSFITLAGLKKCRPSTSCGREVTAAISFTSSVEVLVARMAPGLHDLVELLEHLLLDRHVLEHRLDDDVDVLECRRSWSRPVNRPMRLSMASWRQAALGHRRWRSSCARCPGPCRAPPGSSPAPSPECRRWRSSSRCRRPWCRRRSAPRT